jgi:diguanylate cyclase (GGDEF)-like protein
MKTIEEILDDKIKLPTFPAIALKIIDAVKTDDASMSELTKIVSSDPALVARVLKISNSSFYALPQKVDSIQKALTILGTETLKNIALSFVIVNWMKSGSGESFNYETFWKRAVTAAVAADLISAAIKQRSDDIFITSLLQDIGIVILYLSMPEEYMKVFDEKRVTGLPVAEVEKKLFGFDHTEMGSRIMGKWGLPEAIYEPIAYHHKPKKSPENFHTKVQILWLADRMSSIYHGSKCAEQLKDIHRTLQRSHGFNEEDISKIIDAVAEKTVEILSYFEIDAGNMKPYSQLLIDANEALGKLNVSYEQLILELKRSKESTEMLALELQAANEKLRELATRDGLTGLYNHRHFQESLEKEINRTLRTQTPLSLALLDIDHFKKVNDQYGHQVGDVVLQRIATTLQETVRESDLLARYGGEEFAVILPETELKGGAMLAERLRRAVEAEEISANEATIQITISLGVTTYDPSAGNKGMAAFINAADKGLYHSKETGRNKISLVNMTSG